MTSDELLAILRVFVNLDAASVLKIKIEDIIISFRKWKWLNDADYISLLRRYSNQNMSAEDKTKQCFSFIATISSSVTFEHFNRMLKAAGMYKLSNAIIAEKDGVLHSCPRKRHLPHAEAVSEYFSNLKRCADNNSFQDGTRFRLESMITMLNKKLKGCVPDTNPEQFQILVDKRIMAYFLLAQQFSDMDARVKVMKRMRDSVPHNVDRTLFNVIFHSYMTVIWALKGYVETAESHEQQARFACHLCLPDIAGVISRLCIQYKNNVFFFRMHNKANLNHASKDFEEIFQMFDSMGKDPQIYGLIAKLEMVHTLLGIDWNLDMCDIAKIQASDIEKSRQILSTLTGPCEIRRQMLVCLCRARLCENINPKEALIHAQEALSLAEDGAYYDIEKANIEKYFGNISRRNLQNDEVYLPALVV